MQASQRNARGQVQIMRVRRQLDARAGLSCERVSVSSEGWCLIMPASHRDEPLKAYKNKTN